MAHDPDQTDGALTVTMLLADAAQVSDGKLSVLGGGIAVIAPQPQPLALAFVVSVPTASAGRPLSWVCELLDPERMPVMAGDVPVLVNGEVTAAPPQGWPESQPVNVPVVISFNGLPLQPGSTYTWRLAIDGSSDEAWQLPFSVATQMPTA
jgi:hypothetical protein